MQSATALTDIRWLISSAATPWLAAAANDLKPSVAAVARWRKELSAERVHLLLEQAALRHRAREKFADADRMFFTPLGLEQATDEAIAQYKANRIDERLSNGARVADLCCGIGGDLIALARKGPAVGIDRDPIAALLAEANLTACGLAADTTPNKAKVQIAEIAAFSPAECGAWHIDPDRRPEGRRTTRAVLHDPPPVAIERLLADCPQGAVKLAPAAVLPEGWEARAELEWISSRRECRQVVAWFGGLADHPGTRRATVLSAAREPRPFAGEADVGIAIADRIGRYVFEPDAAILAAGLSGALAAEFGLEAVTPQAAYLTGEPAAHVVEDAALASFEVLEVLPLRIKTLRQWLRDRGIGRLEVKKRGVDVDPRQLAAELKGPGEGAATLLIFQRHEKATVIIARRVQRNGR